MIHFLFQVRRQENFFSLKNGIFKIFRFFWKFRFFGIWGFFWNFDDFSYVHISLHFGSVTILSKYNKSRFHAKKTFIWLVCWVKDQDKYIIYDSHSDAGNHLPSSMKSHMVHMIWGAEFDVHGHDQVTKSVSEVWKNLITELLLTRTRTKSFSWLRSSNSDPGSDLYKIRTSDWDFNTLVLWKFEVTWFEENFFIIITMAVKV